MKLYIFVFGATKLSDIDMSKISFEGTSKADLNTDYIFGNPDVWLTNKTVIENLYILQERVNISGGNNFWLLSKTDQDSILRGLRMPGDADSVLPDYFANRLDAIRVLYNILASVSSTFIDASTVQGIIEEELTRQAEETWKIRIPLYLESIKEKIQKSGNIYIEFANLDKQERKAIQYSLNTYQNGESDRYTLDQMDNLRTRYAISIIDGHPLAIDNDIISALVNDAQSRIDKESNNETFTAISDFMEDNHIGELFYGSVVLWASALIDCQGTAGAGREIFHTGLKNYELIDDIGGEAYVYIREYDDFKIVSDKLGISIEDVKVLKNHLFFNDHNIYGVIQKFAPDQDIAYVWLRTIQGTITDNELSFFKGIVPHELKEAALEAGDAAKGIAPMPHRYLENRVEKGAHLTAVEPSVDYCNELTDVLQIRKLLNDLKGGN